MPKTPKAMLTAPQKESATAGMEFRFIVVECARYGDPESRMKGNTKLRVERKISRETCEPSKLNPVPQALCTSESVHFKTTETTVDKSSFGWFCKAAKIMCFRPGLVTLKSS